MRAKILAGLAAALALGACADAGNGGAGGGLLDRVAGRHILSPSADGVTITGMASAADAWPLAIAHCSHFKRSAQYSRRSGDDYVYRCVDG